MYTNVYVCVSWLLLLLFFFLHSSALFAKTFTTTHNSRSKQLQQHRIESHIAMLVKRDEFEDKEEEEGIKIGMDELRQQ